MSARSCALVLAVLASPYALAVGKPVTCPPVPDGQCPANEPAGNWCPVVLAMQCPTGMGAIKMTAAEAPPDEQTEAMCNYTGGGYHCEAWPKYAGVSYTWSKFGMVNWVTPPFGDYADLTCTPGGNNRVNLTVTSPYGLSTTTTTYVYCGASGEY